METRPDADPAWRCPTGQPCVPFTAALQKDIADNICRRYGLEFKYRYEEEPRPMMFDPALPVWREGRDSSIKRLVDLLVRTAVACRIYLEDTRLVAYRRLANEIGKNISSPSRTAERVLWAATRPPDRREGASRDECSMRAPGRSPGRKFLPLKRFLKPKSRTQQAYSTSFKSSRRDRHESGHTGVVSCETRGAGMVHGARGRAARVRARAPRRMRGGRAGAHLGQGWTAGRA